MSLTISGSTPVDIEMTPVLQVLFELNGYPSIVFAARATIVAGIARALNISSTLIRFAEASNGSLTVSTYVRIDFQPPPFPCTIPEHAVLSYCGARRLSANLPGKSRG